MTIHSFCVCDFQQEASSKEPSLYRQVDIQGTMWVESQYSAIRLVCDMCTKHIEQNIHNMTAPQCWLP